VRHDLRRLYFMARCAREAGHLHVTPLAIASRAMGGSTTWRGRVQRHGCASPDNSWGGKAQENWTMPCDGEADRVAHLGAVRAERSLDSNSVLMA